MIAAGRTTEAIAQYEEALRTDPDSAEAHNNLAFALLNVQRPREAIDHYRKVVELKPDYAEGHLGLGMALAAAGDPQAAAGEFESAVQLQPDSLGGHSRLAETYAALGQPAEAMRAAERTIFWRSAGPARGRASDRSLAQDLSGQCPRPLETIREPSPAGRGQGESRVHG